MRTCALLASVTLLVFGPGSRSDGGEKEEANKKYIEALQGAWQMTSRIDDGVVSPEGVVKNRTITFTGEKYTVRDGKDVFVEVTYKVDAMKQPVCLDITFTDGEVHKGIVQIKDDTLTFCLAEGDRPTEFKSKPGDNRVLCVYKKMKR